MLNRHRAAPSRALAVRRIQSETRPLTLGQVCSMAWCTRTLTRNVMELCTWDMVIEMLR